MDAPSFNGSDNRRDDSPKDWTAPPMERCAWCQFPIERVSIAVLTTRYTSVACCSENCANDLRATLED